MRGAIISRVDLDQKTLKSVNGRHKKTGNAGFFVKAKYFWL